MSIPLPKGIPFSCLFKHTHAAWFFTHIKFFIAPPLLPLPSPSLLGNVGMPQLAGRWYTRHRLTPLAHLPHLNVIPILWADASPGRRSTRLAGDTRGAAYRGTACRYSTLRVNALEPVGSCLRVTGRANILTPTLDGGPCRGDRAGGRATCLIGIRRVGSSFLVALPEQAPLALPHNTATRTPFTRTRLLTAHFWFVPNILHGQTF